VQQDPTNWLRVPIGTEAELDAAEQQAAAEAQAESRMPREAPRDLFGDALPDTPKGRKVQGAREAVRWFRRKMQLAGIHPLDVMARAMMEAAERGDWDKAHARATDLAPYMAPRLSVIATPGAAPVQGSGVVRFTWESGEAAPPMIEGPPS
jgi:hypothetical protein